MESAGLAENRLNAKRGILDTVSLLCRNLDTNPTLFPDGSTAQREGRSVTAFAGIVIRLCQALYGLT